MKAEGDCVHWQSLSPEQWAGILPDISSGQPVRIFSEVLGEVIFWVRDQRAADELKRQGITETAYTFVELVQIQGKSPEFLRDIHRFKKEFGATLAKTEPKPMLRAGRQS